MISNQQKLDYVNLKYMYIYNFILIHITFLGFKIIMSLKEKFRRTQSSRNDMDILSMNNESDMDTCECCSFIPIIHPFSPIRGIWDSIVMVLLIYTCISIPFTIAFEIELKFNSFVGRLSFIIDIMLCIDVILNFRTAYFDGFDRLRLIKNPKKIAKRYLKRWFIIDFISSFPFEFISQIEYISSSIPIIVEIFRIMRIFRIVKLLRFFKMLKLFDGFMKRAILRELSLFLRLIKIICLMLLSSHFCACIWYAIGNIGHKKGIPNWIDGALIYNSNDVNYTPNTWTKYSNSWYWACVTLFTTGYGYIILMLYN